MRVFALFISLIICNLTFGQDKIFTFKGQVHSYGSTLKGATIEVYEGGNLIYETISKGGGKFEFKLTSERQYMAEFSMENLRTKVIWINTKQTQNLNQKVPDFAFDIYLKKEKITRYDELSEIPVTLIKYHPDKNEFFIDEAYENAVKNKKEKIKQNTIPIR